MITMDADISRLKNLVGSWKNVEKDLKVAVNKTVTHTKSQMAKPIARNLNIKQADVKRKLNVWKNSRDPTATVILNKENRPGLNIFGAKQDQDGVSYQIGKKPAYVSRAFQGPKPGVQNPSWNGNVFKRVGLSRLPIVKLKGPSPWGVFVKNDYQPPVVKSSQEYLKKQIRERVRFRLLKAQGKI